MNEKTAEVLSEFSMNIDAFGDVYEYLIGPVCARGRQENHRFATPVALASIMRISFGIAGLRNGLLIPLMLALSVACLSSLERIRRIGRIGLI